MTVNFENGMTALKSLSLELNENQRRFLSQVIRKPGSRRHEIAAELGFSGQTAMRVVQPLVEAGVISETDEVTGTRGKPPKLTHFVQSSLLTVGIVIAPERVTVSFSDLHGQVLTRETERRDFATCLDQLGAIESILSRISNDVPQAARVVSAGVAISGFFLERGRRIVSRVDPEGWAKIDLRQRIELLTGVPTVIENDGRIIATKLLQEERLSNFICVYLDARIGGGIVSDGKLVQGHHGNAGVIGRLFEYGDDRPSEPALRRALGVDQWDRWTGVDSLDTSRRSVLENWLDRAGRQFTNVLNQALPLLDFEAVYICSRIPHDIMELLAKQIGFSPLGANLEDGASKSFVMPAPKILLRPAENFAGMAHVLASRLFLNP